MKVQVALLIAFLGVQTLAVPGGKGGGGGGKGKGHGGGYEDYSYIAHKQVIEYKPVTIQQPVVVHKPIRIIQAPPPELVHKPVVHHVPEWRLVTVPKVSYQPVYVQRVPHYGGGGGKGKGGKKGGW
ncbi:serine, glycine and glutamine-rich protein-like [Macrobrachium nipponense]|uniref:serine, glycine and glutamine-rich protein-like n=1 Tax=Macrobrachium nipponense TaxID=159736 RepID=UPI0030C8A6FF